MHCNSQLGLFYHRLNFTTLNMNFIDNLTATRKLRFYFETRRSASLNYKLIAPSHKGKVSL